MKRVRITAKMRADIFLRHTGICHLCRMKVVPGEDWDVSHEIPLEAGGKDDDTNWLVAHRKCHRTHTSKVDIPLIAKVKRIHQKHIGAKRPKSQMPGGRNSMWKKKMDGSVVRRNEGHDDQKWASNTRKEESFYACPIEHVKFIRIDIEGE